MIPLPDDMLFIISQITIGVTVLTYLLILLCIWRYMKRTAEVPTTDAKWKKSCAGLRSSLKSAVSWGTLAALLAVAICVLSWLFGAAGYQALAVENLLLNAVIMLGSAAVCHLFCTPMLSTMSGSDERDGFARLARRLPNRLIFIAAILLLVYMYLTF